MGGSSGLHGNLICVSLVICDFSLDSPNSRYNSAKKDNDFIYHEAVPALDTLQPVKGLAAEGKLRNGVGRGRWNREEAALSLSMGLISVVLPTLRSPLGEALAGKPHRPSCHRS